ARVPAAGVGSDYFLLHLCRNLQVFYADSPAILRLVDDSNIKGAVAEQAIVLAATKLGVPVLRPVSEHGRSDLAFDIGGRLWRVQVKWGRLSTAGDVIYVKLMTQRCTPRGYVRRKYGESEIDLFAVYCGELNRSFLIPSDRAAGMAQFMLRVAPALNSQRACINLADD